MPVVPVPAVKVLKLLKISGQQFNPFVKPEFTSTTFAGKCSLEKVDDEGTAEFTTTTQYVGNGILKF